MGTAEATVEVRWSMIRVDLIATIALVLFFVLLFLLAAWLKRSSNQQPYGYNKFQTLLQCPFCTHLFFDSSATPRDNAEQSRNSTEKINNIKVCPKCKSYFNPNEIGGKD